LPFLPNFDNHLGDPIMWKKRSYEQRKMSQMIVGLGIGVGSHSMVHSQSTRNQRPLNFGPVTEKQKGEKMKKLVKGLGIGMGSHSMVHNQSTRNGRDRGHGELTKDQAYDITAEILIRQRGKCWVTGSDLVVNGYSGDLRSYSIDRLDDSQGYSVENCRAVCVWVNFAASYSAHSKIQLWRHLSQLGPIHTPVSDDPDFRGIYTDREFLEDTIQCGGFGGCRIRGATKTRAQRWFTFFDLPKIVPLVELTDKDLDDLMSLS
jgi:hypothetical protein